MADLALIALFFGALWLPLAANFFRLELTPPTREYRRLAPWPHLQIGPQLLSTFPAQFEAYFRDHFGFRSALIHALNVTRVGLLKVSTNPLVMLGRDGWLFYTDRPVGSASAPGLPLPRNRLARWQHALRARRDWLATRGIAYLIVIPPDKQTIYPEQLPPKLRGWTPSHLDQLLAYLGPHSDLPILDLREPLRRAKSWGLLYFATDTHWNQRGAFVAYQQIIAALGRQLQRLRPPLPRSAFEDIAVGPFDGDLIRMLGLPEGYTRDCNIYLQPHEPRRARPALVSQRGSNPPLTAFECAELGQPRAVMFHDSFAPMLAPFLSEHFQRIVYVPSFDFDAGLVQHERPDVVIHELAERMLCRSPADDVPSPDSAAGP
jgi:hypothetical protein